MLKSKFRAKIIKLKMAIYLRSNKYFELLLQKYDSDYYNKLIC